MNPENSIHTWSARAKLMITGEYLVLKGADALAIPLKYQQSLSITELPGNPVIEWKTFVKGQHWFDVVFSLDEFVIGNTNDFPTAQNLREILIAAKQLQPAFLGKKIKYQATSDLDFEINWGMGSSSSLLVNIARWAGVSVFELQAKIAEGSGYDLAVAMSDKPLVYRIKDGHREVREVDFYPPFHRQLYFAYLGKKRNTLDAVNKFNKLPGDDYAGSILEINEITKSMLATDDLRVFRKLMREHEKIISGIIGVPAVSEKLLNDFSGEIKSLGAWGGDFIMLATDMPREYVLTWLRKKEMNTWFSYEDIALNPLENH